MGFWDKLKQAKNYFTGGGAEVSVQFTESPKLRSPFLINIKAIVDTNDVPIERVSIRIKNIESSTVRLSDAQLNKIGALLDSRSSHKRPTGSMRYSNILDKQRTFSSSSVICKEEIEVQNEMILKANEEYNWPIEIRLPDNGMAPFNGSHSRIYWTMIVYLEKGGNDPDSGVIEFVPEFAIN